MDVDYKALFERLTKRYGNVTPKALESILCPVLIPIHALDKTIHKVAGQSHYRASFTIKIDADCEDLVAPGRTGKFVSKAYKDGGVWQEIVKGRILSVDRKSGVAEGEIYTGSASKKDVLEKALAGLSQDDFLEVDQYGASAKVLSGLVEYSLLQDSCSHHSFRLQSRNRCNRRCAAPCLPASGGLCIHQPSRLEPANTRPSR